MKIRGTTNFLSDAQCPKNQNFVPHPNENHYSHLDSPLERRVYNTNSVLVQVLRKIE
jgi:hypothetical protein